MVPPAPQPSFQITSVKDSVLRDQDIESRCNSVYGSRESLYAAGDRRGSKLYTNPLAMRRSNNKSMPRLNILQPRTQPPSAGPSSPRPERRSDPTPPTPTGEYPGRASQLHQKNMTELNKGLDSIFHLKPSRTPFASRPPSRASVYEEPVHADTDSGYMTYYVEPEKKKPTKSPRGLFKSHSRASIFDDHNSPFMDDCEVYHTFTGGKSNSIAATRAPLPFAKITRRPARLLAHMSSLVDEAGPTHGCDPGEFDTESVISLNDDMWRVRSRRLGVEPGLGAYQLPSLIPYLLPNIVCLLTARLTVPCMCLGHHCKIRDIYIYIVYIIRIDCTLVSQVLFLYFLMYFLCSWMLSLWKMTIMRLQRRSHLYRMLSIGWTRGMEYWECINNRYY